MSSTEPPHDSYPVPVDVRVVTAPNKLPALLIQLPDGYVLLTSPDGVRQLAETISEGAEALEIALRPYA